MNPTTILRKVWRGLGGKPARPDGFGEMADRFSRRMREFSAPFPPVSRPGKVAVLITPWMCTPVPFFSLECAWMLRREGFDVTLLWDRSNVFFNAARGREIEAVERVLKGLPAAFHHVDVSAITAPSAPRTDALDLLLYENAVRQIRSEGGAPAFLAANPERTVEMYEHAGRVRKVLEEGDYSWVLIPGGVWAASGLYVQIAENLGVSYTTFDCGPGAMYLAHDGVAAHLGDVPGAFRDIKERLDRAPAERDEVIRLAKENLQVRMEGRDEYRLQPQPASASVQHRCDILVPLNYRADTAALCRQRIFPSITAWLEALLGWLETRPGVTLSIRQHPCERIEEFKGHDHWDQLIARFPAVRDQVTLVLAEDTVNTYDLLRCAAVVLPYTSRVGIEAALLGKPAILSTHCYYESCGFTWNASSAEEYFALIDQALAGQLQVTPEQRDSAALAYHIVERCLELRTDFTPTPAEFARWVEIPPEELWSQPALLTVREALVSRRRLPLLRYESLLEAP
ncbi:MAG: hypothetical protein ABJF10_01510 [Chthoniobacter sp.]|uniref:capsular polysaccharide export protein, LipB/KpsS family n=1 Tax=Chthoniobacter sp. TaxID=2510640 RepID=UPI0032A7FEA6